MVILVLQAALVEMAAGPAAMVDNLHFLTSHLTFEVVLPVLLEALEMAVVAVAVLPVDPVVLAAAAEAAEADPDSMVTRAVVVAPVMQARLALTVTRDQVAQAHQQVTPVLAVMLAHQATQEQTAIPVLEPQVVELATPVQLVQTDQLEQPAIPVLERLLVTPVLAVMPEQQVM